MSTNYKQNDRNDWALSNNNDNVQNYGVVQHC